MKTSAIIKETLEELLIKIGVQFNSVEVEEKEENVYFANVNSDEANTLIGHHGSTIYAIQHILKILCWAKTKKAEEFNIVLDVGNYRKKQEESVINLAERKVEFVRKTRRAQSLPPMSPYFRRVVHMYLNQEQFDDITTESRGEGDSRHIIIQQKA